MTQLKLLNVRSIERGTLDFDRLITLVAGWNEEGKTSIAYAMRALLSDQPWPITGKPAIDGALMCADGETMGAARLIEYDGGEDPQYTVTWPAGGFKEEPEGCRDHLPWASAYATGARQFVSETPTSAQDRKERFAAFQDIFKAMPSDAQLIDALKAAEVEDITRKKNPKDVLALVSDQGWEPAAKVAHQNGIRAQGAWCHETGRQKWGKNIGVDWMPDTSDEDPMAEVALPDLVPLQMVIESTMAALEDALTAHAAVPDPEVQVNPIRCPHCDGEVQQRDGRWVKAASITTDDLKKIRLQRASLAAVVSNAQIDHGQAQRVYTEAKAQHDAASASKVDTTAVIARAAELHREILRWQAIADVLGPAGVRKTVLEGALREVNERLEESSAIMGLAQPIRFGTGKDDMLEVYLGDRHYLGLCGAEKWRVRALLQIHIAALDKSDMVVLDEASTLVRKQDRQALLRCLKHAGVKALVFMAVARPDQVPDIGTGKNPIGRTYWVQGGKVVPIAEALTVTAEGVSEASAEVAA